MKVENKKETYGWGGWPFEKKAAAIFHKEVALQNLRCLNTETLRHERVKITGKPRACQLCMGERQTMFESSVCKVRLCTTLKKGERKEDGSHFERWHKCGCLDLLEERDKVVEQARALIKNDKTEREEDGRPQRGNLRNNT